MSVFKKSALVAVLVLMIGLLLAGCTLPTSTETPAYPTVETKPEEVSALPENDETPLEEQAEQVVDVKKNTTQPIDANFTIVDTGQSYCYDNAASIPCPESSGAYFGQDGQYVGNQPKYEDNSDGTISDMNTGLMWVKDPGTKLTYDQAVSGAASFNLAGYDDWRLPTIQELYSLILFSGFDPSGCASESDCPGLVPFIDTSFFDFKYGQPDAGERLIDAQYISSSPYIGQGLGGSLVFGVNFADGRIKGYGTGPMPGQTESKTFYVLYVRGGLGYGMNEFVDNSDGTISDQTTGLTWMQTDNQQAVDWQDALVYCGNLSWAGNDDWRLPNVKELHSIVDLSRSPDTSNTAAINPLFQSTPFTNEVGQPDYGYYWTSTTHLNYQTGATDAVYLAFGRALGYIDGNWADVHGAGAQRSDPKTGNPINFPEGRGPQGDAIRILNFARCVRGGVSSEIITGGEIDPNVPTSLIGEEGEPPPEAYEACEGKTINTACQYEGVIGPMDGVCHNLFNQLVCIPGIVLPTFPSP
jgi:hypothetical protein